MFQESDWQNIHNLILKTRHLEDLECSFTTKECLKKTGLFSLEIINYKGLPGCLITLTDITKYKELENQLSRLNRLNLIGELAASIGHEIRNPMTSVRGFLQLLQAKKETSQFQDYFKLMIEELDRTNSIITEFLSLAKEKAIIYSALNLNDIITTLYPLLSADAINSDKIINLDLNPLIDLHLNEQEIRQLILNLTRNALEAMEKGKELTISTFMNEKNEVVLSIKDQGSGIPLDILEKIGTPFFTTKENGTGLGLAMCFNIAAKHNAEIRVDTSPQGSIFNIHFHNPKAIEKQLS